MGRSGLNAILHGQCKARLPPGDRASTIDGRRFGQHTYWNGLSGEEWCSHLRTILIVLSS